MGASAHLVDPVVEREASAERQRLSENHGMKLTVAGETLVEKRPTATPPPHLP